MKVYAIIIEKDGVLHRLALSIINQLEIDAVLGITPVPGVESIRFDFEKDLRPLSDSPLTNTPKPNTELDEAWRAKRKAKA